MSITESIIDLVARRYNLTASDLTGKRRTPQNVVKARHEAMYELREAGLSFPAIGKLLNRTHATVIYGVRRHRQTVTCPAALSSI